MDAEYFKAIDREKFTATRELKDDAWTLGVAYQVTEPLELAARYETFDNGQTGNATGDFDSTVAFGANYNILENVTFMVEYRLLNGESGGNASYDDSVNEFNFRTVIEF
jgi:predicted porin